MLVLTRKCGEKVQIGNDIVLTVIGVQGNRIKLGIDAPLGIPVHRQELHNRLQSELGSQELSSQQYSTPTAQVPCN